MTYFAIIMLLRCYFAPPVAVAAAGADVLAVAVRGELVPITGSFSVPGNLEGLGQVQGGLVQRQAMDLSPQIHHIPLDRTLIVKALKGVLAQGVIAPVP